MGKPSGESQSLQNAQTTLANTMSQTGQQSANEGATLFNLGLPGLQQSESYYTKLSSGDPAALATANAPAIQGITEQSAGAKKNIVQDNPRGGERNLALEEADISKGAQISNLTTQSYTGSFGSLAGLGGQNVSQGNAATGTGLQGMNAAANQYGQLQQLGNEQKATQLGFISSLAGAAGEGAGAICWIAMAYWGDFDARTFKVRRWLMQTYAETFTGGLFVAAYRKYGRTAARWFEASAVVRMMLCPLFDSFLRRAEGVA